MSSEKSRFDISCPDCPRKQLWGMLSQAADGALSLAGELSAAGLETASDFGVFAQDPFLEPGEQAAVEQMSKRVSDVTHGIASDIADISATFEGEVDRASQIDCATNADPARCARLGIVAAAGMALGEGAKGLHERWHQQIDGAGPPPA